jgi:hypothetical protein
VPQCDRERTEDAQAFEPTPLTSRCACDGRFRSKAMRALIQRVSSASVAVDGEVVGEIGEGLVVLVAIGAEGGSV